MRVWHPRTTCGLAGQCITFILTLNASAGEMGILKALHHTPVLLFGLFIGVWLDRAKRYPLMITSEFGQGIFVATIPVAAVLGVLRIELLYLVSFFSGTLSAIYILASLSFLPSIVDQEDLIEANSKLSAGRSVAKIVGPGLAGILVDVLTAPFTVAFNAFSSLTAGVCLLSSSLR